MGERVTEKGIRVIALAQETTDDPAGHLMEGIFELFDQWESEINGGAPCAHAVEGAAVTVAVVAPRNGAPVSPTGQATGAIRRRVTRRAAQQLHTHPVG